MDTGPSRLVPFSGLVPFLGLALRASYYLAGETDFDILALDSLAFFSAAAASGGM